MPDAVTATGVIAVASGIVLLDAGVRCNGAKCDKYWGWAIACTVISFIVSVLASQGMAFGVPAIQAKISVISLFLLIWWLAGTGVMTFESPYHEHGTLGTGPKYPNGYFGCWVALGMAWQLAMASWPKIKEPFDALSRHAGSSMALLLCASGATLVQASVDCADKVDGGGECKGEFLWVMICAAGSLFLGIVIMLLRTKGVGCVEANWKFITLFFLVWWIAGCGVATEFADGPYPFIGNGYFGCWGSVIASALLCAEAWGQSTESAAGTVGTTKEVFMLGFFSLVVMIRASRERGEMEDDMRCAEAYPSSLRDQPGFMIEECAGFYGWAVACSVISLFLCLVVILLAKIGKPLGDKLKFLAPFLLLWWIAGWYTMTFEKPFRLPGNGFFGAWGCMFTAGKMVVKNPLPCFGSMQGAANTLQSKRTEAVVMLLSGFVVLVQSATDCAEMEKCESYHAYAVAVGAVGVLFPIAILSPIGEKLPLKPLSAFLAIWWATGAGLLTFDKPYVSAQNAYFALWAGCIFAMLFALKQYGMVSETVDVSFGAIAGMLAAEAGPAPQTAATQEGVVDTTGQYGDEVGRTASVGAQGGAQYTNFGEVPPQPVTSPQQDTAPADVCQ